MFGRHELTIDGGAGVASLGGAFLFVALAGRVSLGGTTLDIVQAGYVGGASLILLAGGLWVVASEWTRETERRVLAWTLLGGVFLVALAFTQLWDQQRADVVVSQPRFVVYRLAVFGCLGGFVAGFYDARSRRERARAEDHSTRFTTLFERAPLPLVTLTGQGNVVMWNEAATTLFGYESDAVVGSFYPLVPADRGQEFAEHLDRVRDGGTIEGYRTKRQRKDGTLLDVELWVTPLTGSSDESGLVLAVFRDLTATAIIDEQRVVMQRVFRHNLRNELSVVQGYAEQIEAGEADDPRASAATVLDAADRLVQLSEHVSRLELDGTISSVDVASLVRSVVTDARAAYPAATVTLDAPDEARAQTVAVIEDAFAEALENAVVHADTPTPRVDVTVEQGTDFVTVRFADDGPGIPDAEWTPVTNATERPLQHASGLGLWMMHWAVARSGGTLTRSEATRDGGAVLTFSFPRTAAAVRERGTGSRASPRADD